MNGNGTSTTIVNEGLTGLPATVVWMVLLAMVFIAAWRYCVKENHRSVMIPAAGALLAFYVAVWSFWLVLTVALIALTSGLVYKLFPQTKHVASSATRAGVAAARTKPATTPAPRPAAKRATPPAE